jgi:hypothetical protein
MQKANKPEKNLSQVRNVWKRQQRDSKGRFIKIDTSVQASDNSSPTYQFCDIEKAFYAGSNATRMYSILKQFEIFCKQNNYKNIS